MKISRATLCASAGVPGDRERLDAWLDRWRLRLSHFSGNQGCGCCVDLYDVEAPAEALAELPARLFADSEWARSEAAPPFPPRNPPA